MKTKLAALLIVACTTAHAQPGPAWAWNAGKITNNGSVTVKSTNGASTYNAVQNPVGAVAKTNQSAVTQPPTVIIQATGGGYAETIPMVAANSLVPPSCPAGYTRVFATSGTGCNTDIIMNVAGTRWTFGQFTQAYNVSTPVMGWRADGAPIVHTSPDGPTSIGGPGATCRTLNSDWSSTNHPWAASLCSK